MEYLDSTFVAQSFGKSKNFTDIQASQFKEYNVKKGLRNEDGTGVRVGLTRISDVVGYELQDGKKMNAPGELYYRGYRLGDLVNGKGNSHFGYEEVCFLILFGYLPTKEEFKKFREVLAKCYELPTEFFDMHILRQPSQNLMNALQQSVLSLYDYDSMSDDIDPYHMLLKGINIMAKLVSIMCYSYGSKMHYYHGKSLVVHYPRKDYSIAENILYMLREDRKFTEKEAKLLDILLMVHAEHGGGNNSAFTSVVIGSTNTDIYSSFVGALGSLKGPRHGGANIRCAEMMDAIIREIGYDADEEAIKAIIARIMDKEFYDHSGLVYGMGHAVYTQSDPRAEILQEYCRELAEEKGRMKEFEFMKRFDKIARVEIARIKGKDISNNVDYYSGFAYDMLGLPRDLYTPLFAVSRSVGWIAHIIENNIYDGRIMRPATKYVGELKEYQVLNER